MKLTVGQSLNLIWGELNNAGESPARSAAMRSLRQLRKTSKAMGVHNNVIIEEEGLVEPSEDFTEPSEPPSEPEVEGGVVEVVLNDRLAETDESDDDGVRDNWA